MIKLIIFDLDGVLVEAKEIHFEALNQALGREYFIDWNEHLSIYDGLKTMQKLQILTKNKNLPPSEYNIIWEKKQQITLQKLKSIQPKDELISLMKNISDKKYKIAVCSNSIRKTVLTVLSKLNIIEYMDFIISNEDVKNSKPHPEMYWTAISKIGC